jgi:dTDP-4-dehydro-6-deoxy-alpha-D-glucopyranose 2,3-dehydratase
MTGHPEWLRGWFEHIEDLSDLRIAETTLDASKHWKLSDGAIQHDSGRFFSVVGIRWTAPDGTVVSQPMFKQQEQATQGFLLREGDKGNELLAYAKIEPGNVDTVQLAPTCQATGGNISRAHGGQAPPFADAFEPGSAGLLYDVLHSEQGTRFLGKRNRNVLALARNTELLPLTHRWLAAEEILDLLELDFTVNTDARSVLVCCPWEKMVGRTPFSRYGSGFGRELARSAAENGEVTWLSQLREKLESEREKTAEPVTIDLHDVTGWRVTESGVEPESAGPFRVFQIKVDVRGREVSSWDQPIISSAGEGSIDLLCGRREGVLNFLLRPYAEPGLFDLVQLGPVVQEPGGAKEESPIDVGGALVRMECRQSEEGARFFRDTNRFRIVDVGEACEAADGWQWFTLAQIRRLLDEAGWFTNEARSALSLLLKWL